MAHSNDIGSMLVKVEDTLSEYLVKKAPVLPKGFKDILVAIIPWFTLVGVILSIPLLLLALGINTFALPFAPSDVAMGTVGLILLAITVIIEALALPGLFKRQRKGWELLFYASLVGILSLLFGFSIAGLLGTILGFYLLFQVREYYK